MDMRILDKENLYFIRSYVKNLALMKTRTGKEYLPCGWRSQKLGCDTWYSPTKSENSTKEEKLAKNIIDFANDGKDN